MKSLTLTQPWSSLVAMERKRVETRGWKTAYRGTLAIHAAKGFPSEAKDICFAQPFAAALRPYQHYPAPGRVTYELPCGFIVALVDLVDIYPTERVFCNPLVPNVTVQHGNLVISSEEHAFGNYSPGRFAWVFDNIRGLPEPIPAKGALSLWEWDEKGLK